MDLSISNRGIEAINTELRPDFKIFFEAAQNIYDKDLNPEGSFPLNMAENILCWPMIRNRINEIFRTSEVPDWVANYTGMGGSEEFLKAMSEFISEHLAKTTIDPSHLAASAGVTAVLELASWILCDSGEVAVFPAPSYPVYTQDIGNKARVERCNLQLFHDLDEVQYGLGVTIDKLEDTKGNIEKEGKVFKLLVITRPDNPTGVVCSPSELESIATWCANNKIHLIINEVYGLSSINTQHPAIASDYRDHSKFESAFTIVKRLESDYVHIIYGVSKDFSMSGFRAGLIYSLNKNFLSAYKNLNAPHLVSNLTQWTIIELFKDNDFLSTYISLNQKEITESYVIVIGALRKLEIPYIPIRGGLYVWIDLSNYLSHNSSEAESDLWLSMYNETGILLTPGQGFGHSKFGQFRLVFTFLKRETIKTAMKGLEKYLQKKQVSVF